MSDFNNCDVIGDLLPLYVDQACSGDSAALVEAHLEGCGGCKKLYQGMTANTKKVLGLPEFDSRQMLRGRLRMLLVVLFMVVMLISCYACNIGGAFQGYPADVQNLCATLVYVSCWSIFTILSRDYKPLARLSFWGSLLTFGSAAWGLACVLFGRGWIFSMLIVSMLIAGVSYTPFYGFECLFDFRGGYQFVYVTAAVVSLIWLVYTYRHCRKFRASGRAKAGGRPGRKEEGK